LQKKKKKKKKKKGNFIREEDRSASWHYSDANSSPPALSESWGSEKNTVSDKWLMTAERQTHRKEMKKERDKTALVGQQGEVSYI
jgi:hypothetical protein